jgi:putative Ca2+/H+ antiporter (TMEM165/GDT1 family)
MKVQFKAILGLLMYTSLLWGILSWLTPGLVWAGSLEEVSIPDFSGQSFLVIFITVFFAEMGDKTQLATMLMSAQSASPWSIFFGSASALITASLISVLLGDWLTRLVPPETLQLVAGSGFILIGCFVLFQELRENPQDPLIAPMDPLDSGDPQ